MKYLSLRLAYLLPTIHQIGINKNSQIEKNSVQTITQYVDAQLKKEGLSLEASISVVLGPNVFVD